MLLSFVAGCLGIEDADCLDLDQDINSDLVEVDGYETAEGTWVEPYVRTAPNDSLTDNLGWWNLTNA